MKKHLPGDSPYSKYIEQVIRVNHAGEYGAKRIYEGQLAVIKDPDSYKTIAHMAKQEEAHLSYFEEQLKKRRIRPTALMPFWHVAGFILGAGTALLGKKTAMTCTEAVEEVIDKHYQKQLSNLSDDDEDLKTKIEHFRQEELEHHHTAIENKSQESLGYSFISQGIKAGCKIAIWLAKRI